MYSPSHFLENDPAKLAGLIGAWPLATLVSMQDGSPAANVLPMLLSGDTASGWTLHGHMARKNPQWQHSGEVLALFHGPDAYVSPNWFASKQATGRGVPTWNYAMVQARGTLTPIHDPQWLRAHLAELSARFEQPQSQPWQIDDAPPDYIDGMLGAIVGIEIRLSALTGKLKLSQNRDEADHAGIVAGLLGQGPEKPGAQQVAQLMIGQRTTR